MPRLKKVSQFLSEDSPQFEETERQPEQQQGSSQQEGSNSHADQEKSAVTYRLSRKKRGNNRVSNKDGKELRLARAEEALKKMISDADGHDSDEDAPAEIPDSCLAEDAKKGSKKGTVKCKNKFFNFELNPKEAEENQEQSVAEHPSHHELIAKPKNEEELNYLNKVRLDKIEQRANRIKNRLEFKDIAGEDPRYKEALKKKLEDVKAYEDLELIIQIPRVFKGTNARHNDGALYIKNMQKTRHDEEESQPEMSCEHPNNASNSNKRNKQKVDRKMFYSQFSEEIKSGKIFDFHGKQYFKKSTLEELETQLEQKQFLFQHGGLKSDAQQASRSRYSSTRRTNSLSTQKSHNSSEHVDINTHKGLINQKTDTSKISIKQEKQSSTSALQISNKVTPNENERHNEQTVKTDKKPVNSNKRRKKHKDPHRERKMSKKQISEFFEDEAEDSNEGYGDDGESTDSADDNADLEDLYDRGKVKYNARNQRNARKAHMQTLIKQDQAIVDRIRQRILNPQKIRCENSESRKRRNRRIQEAKKRLEMEDSSEDIVFGNAASCQNRAEDNEDPNEADKNNEEDFQKQLEQLEDEIGVKNRKDKSFVRNQSGDLIRKSTQAGKHVWRNIRTRARGTAAEKRGGFVATRASAVGARIKLPKRMSPLPKSLNFQ